MKRILEWNLTRMQVRISQIIKNIKKIKQRITSPSSMLDYITEWTLCLHISFIWSHYGYIHTTEKRIENHFLDNANDTMMEFLWSNERDCVNIEFIGVFGSFLKNPRAFNLALLAELPISKIALTIVFATQNITMISINFLNILLPELSY